MRRFTLIVLSLALGCVWGCSRKTVESETAAKTENSAANDSSKSDVAQKTENGNVDRKTTDPPENENKVAENTNPSNTNTTTKTKATAKSEPSPANTTNEPVPNTKPTERSNSANLPAEFAAFSFIPRSSFALLSGRPNAVLNSALLKSIDQAEIPLDELLTKQAERTGIDPRDIDRVTLAVWIGKGHAFPGQMNSRSFENQRFEKKSSSKRAVKTGRAFKRAERIDAPKVEAPKIESREMKNARPRLEKNEAVPESCDEIPAEAQFEVAYQPGGGLGGLFGPKFDAVVVFNFNKPFDLKRIEENSFGDVEALEHNGVGYRANFNTAFYMPNPKTLLLCPKGDMPTVLDNAQTAKIVTTAIDKHLDHDVSLVVDLKPTRLWLQGLAIMLDEQQPGLADLPSQLEGITAYIDVAKDIRLDVAVNANTEDAPRTIQSFYEKGYGFLGQMIAFELPTELKKEMGEELGGQMTKLIHSIYAGAKGEAEGERFRLTLKVPETVTDILPAYAKRQREIVRAMVGKNNLKQIGIAIHNFHDTFNEFPFPNGRSNAPDAEKNKLSWRVHLLPYLDQYPLYEQFKLDEAWDSEHNKKLLAKMPDVYKLSEETKPNHTQLVLPGGEGFLGAKNRASTRIRDVTDGLTNTIMVLTVVPDKAVPWTKPGPFEFDLQKASDILGSNNRGFFALFGDGHVRTLDENIDAKNLKALLTTSGSERVYPDEFDLRR